jgi:hypothetical protein
MSAESLYREKLFTHRLGRHASGDRSMRSDMPITAGSDTGGRPAWSDDARAAGGRKGTGHPDTICDALVEAISHALSRMYLERVWA